MTVHHTVDLCKGTDLFCAICADGVRAAYDHLCIDHAGVTVHSSETDVKLMGIDLPRVLAAAFSPEYEYMMNGSRVFYFETWSLSFCVYFDT